MLLSAREYWSALRELAQLKRLQARTGEDIRTLISVPDHIRESLEAFCAAASPEDAAPILEALAYRDFMLERL